MIALINNKKVEVELVMERDSDPSAAIWVYEVKDPDVDHFIFADQIITE